VAEIEGGRRPVAGMLQWLETLGLAEYAPLFEQHRIDGEVLADLTDDELRQIGIPLGHRKKLLKAIAALEPQRAAVALPAAREAASEDRADRRQVTVAFIDLVGSTPLSARLDPEELGAVLRTYHQRCVEAIERFDGHVAERRGDGVLALFGYPRAHEDDAERAVRAALAALENVAAIDLPGAGGTNERITLQTRVGIATGLVVAGELVGKAGHATEGVIGETPNLAARLQALAEPGTIVISQATRRLLGNLFELAPLGPQALKGFATAVSAYRVLREGLAQGRFEALRGRETLLPMVGRDQDFALLAERWRLAQQGEGQVVLLCGEPGIGKSRLTRALADHVRAGGDTRVQYLCSVHHISSALWPVISQLERAADIARHDAEALKLAKLEALLAGTEPGETLPLLADLLSIRLPEAYPPLTLTPLQRKNRTLGALTRQLEALSERGPVLLVVEDAHWLDPTSLELLDRFVDLGQRLRLLILITFRPEFIPPWRHYGHASSIVLHRLTRAATAELAEHVARGRPLPAEVLEQIRARTDGVPLFVEELTKTLLESGLLREEGVGYAADAAFQELAIPSTLQDSLTARLDRLASVREIAQIAAAIGRDFPLDLLAAVSGRSADELTHAMSRLVEAEVVYPRGSGTNLHYHFKHALVRDAAYATLLKSRRHLLHTGIADAMTRDFSEIAAGEPDVVAHHYTEGGQYERAIEWWRRAGERAIRRSASEEALRLLGRALQLLEQRPSGVERDAQELEMRIYLSGPLIARHGYVSEPLATNYAKAWELCERTGRVDETFPVMYGQWVLPYVHGDVRASEEVAARFVSRAERTGDSGLRMVGHRLLGSSMTWRGNSREGRQHLQTALGLFDPAAHDALAFLYSQHPRVAALAHLCHALQHQGYPDQALAAGREAIELAKVKSHFNSIAYSLCFVGLLLMLRRDEPAVQSLAEELLAVSGEHGATYWERWANLMLGWAMARRGRTDEGLAQVHEHTATLRSQRANIWVPQTLLAEAEMRAETGQCAQAARLIEEAGALIGPPEQRYYESELHRVSAAVLAASGAGRDAQHASLQRAIEVARAQGSKSNELRASVDLARLYRQQGEAERGRALLRPVHDAFDEGFDTLDLREAVELLAEEGAGAKT